MATVIDIIFCVHFSSSMMRYFNETGSMTLNLAGIKLVSTGKVRIGLIKFRLLNNEWTT